MKPLLATVWHTGTNYIMKEFKRNRLPLEHQHTGPELWLPEKKDRFHRDRRLITTMRDPLDVAVSWANRYDMMTPMYQWHWTVVWAGWERFLSYGPEIREVEQFINAVERSAGDAKGMKALVCEPGGEAEFFQNYFPERLFDDACKIYEEVNPDLLIPEPSDPDALASWCSAPALPRS